MQRGRREAAWSRFLAEKGESCPFASIGGLDFDGRVAFSPLLEAQIAWIVGGPLKLKDAPADAVGPKLCIYAVVDGDIERRGAGDRPVRAGPGDVLIRRGAPAAEIRSEGPVRLAAAVFPERLLQGRIVPPAALRARAANRSGDLAARLLHDLLTVLTMFAERPRATRAILEVLIAATAMMLDQHAVDPPPVPSRVAARMTAVGEHMRRCYPDPGLTAAKTAEASQISVRYLHKLMIGSGRSFREELTRLRLEACRSALIDPSRSGETIAEIAFAAGFGDLSQFNRHFRSAFGMTPSEARSEWLATAKGEED